MQVHYNYTEIPAFEKPVITIGSFDGIHVGHRKIIEQLTHEAKRIQGESVLITFDPHPRQVLFPEEKPIQLLQTLDEKIPILKSLGLNHLVVVPFTTAFANQSAEAYVADFLVNCFHPHTLIIGYDHHFGRNREGNLQTLQALQSSYHFHVLEIPAEEINQMAVSSSKIRQALLHGDIQTANHFLCEPFSVTGKVVRGEQLGRKLGYPTANIEVEHTNKLIPSEGVYAVEVSMDKKLVQGMIGIGKRPTLGDGLKRTLEVHLFDFNEDIYDKRIQVIFKHWLRADRKFESLQALQHALQEDEKQAKLALLRNE